MAVVSRGVGDFCANPTCTRLAAPGGSLCYGCIRTYRSATIATRERTVKLYAVSGAKVVKIGITSGDMPRRLFALQTGSPVKLTLLGFVSVPPHYERRVHSALRAQRQHGEWFKPEGLALEIISRIEARDAPGLEAILAAHRF